MRNFLIVYLFFSALLYSQNPNFDQDIIISTYVDTTEVKIGEELNFKIDISSKNKYNISFDEIPNFMPFEILESFDTDTIQDSSTFSKKYSLINFEPGEYWMPPQKIYFNQSIKYSDSLLIVVNDVEVDTLKQFKRINGLNFNTVLFDNMSPKNLKVAIKYAKGKYETEASGGITLKNVKNLAATKVDRISVGELTHSIQALDLKLEI